jgi:hypothetical protein
MTITILGIRRVQIRPNEAIFGLVADVEIDDGITTYATSVGGIPDGLTRAQIQTALDNRFDEVWSVASQGKPIIASILENPDLNVLMVAAALALVMVDEINVLRSEHGLAPRTAQQAYNAVRAKYIKLGQE